jgi:2-polyprenyl-6-methoxyphenol hydroxylase-like FAD-dependent oxidoreductase
MCRTFHAQLLARLESWPIQRIVHRNERVDIDGNGFSAIGRLELNRFLQELCAAAGVEFEYRRPIISVTELNDCDLLVGADGANSAYSPKLRAPFRARTYLAHESLRLVWDTATVRVS